MSVTSWIRRQFKNGVSITDTVPLGFASGAMSFVAADGTTFPDGSVGPFILTADEGQATEEKILIATRSGATFNVASGGRGYNGTTAYDHGAGCTIYHTLDQQDLDEANQVAVQTLGAVQAAGDLLVGSGAHALAKLTKGASGDLLAAGGSTLGYVTPSAAIASADILTPLEKQFTADNQIVVGTGSGTGTVDDLLSVLNAGYFTTAGQILVRSAGGILVPTDLLEAIGDSVSGATGQALRATGGSTAAWEAAPSKAGHLTSDYTCTTSVATFLTTASLGVGTWRVDFHGVAECVNPAGSHLFVNAAEGTATATLEGAFSSQAQNPSNTTSLFAPLTMSFIATVTVAGTLIFQAIASSTSEIIHHTTGGFSNATGYTAVQL